MTTRVTEGEDLVSHADGPSPPSLNLKFRSYIPYRIKIRPQAFLSCCQKSENIERFPVYEVSRQIFRPFERSLSLTGMRYI